MADEDAGAVKKSKKKSSSAENAAEFVDEDEVGGPFPFPYPPYDRCFIMGYYFFSYFI